MEIIMSENQSDLKLKAAVLDMINHLLNLIITSKQNVEDDLWINENGSHRRFVFKAFQNGDVEIFFQDVLIATHNKNSSVLTCNDTAIDAVNFLLA